jgi:hypothetical protein
MNRFMWEEAKPAKLWGTQLYKRTKSGLHFDGVLEVSSQNILTDRKQGVLELLTIKYEASDEENGSIHLKFAGGGSVKLEVECLEVSMQDLGEPWTATNKPDHGD